jgi:hypothetical protein
VGNISQNNLIISINMVRSYPESPTSVQDISGFKQSLLVVAVLVQPLPSTCFVDKGAFHKLPLFLWLLPLPFPGDLGDRNPKCLKLKQICWSVGGLLNAASSGGNCICAVMVSFMADFLLLS